jgi:hypothetical protein
MTWRSQQGVGENPTSGPWTGRAYRFVNFTFQDLRQQLAFDGDRDMTQMVFFTEIGNGRYQQVK